MSPGGRSIWKELKILARIQVPNQMGHSVTLISTDNLLGSQFFNEFGKPQQIKITPFIDSSFSLGKYKYKTQLGLFVVSKKMVSSTD